MTNIRRQAGWNGLRGTVRRLLWAMGGMLLLGLSQAWAGVSVTLTAPPNGSTYTAPANITLTATARTTQGYTVSKVEFFRSGATLIGTDITAPYSFNWNGVPVGTYTITAVATAVKKNKPNQTATSAPVNITVNAPNVPPTVSMTSPANNATFTAPANITLTATAADSDGTIAKVEFFYGGANLIATLTVPPYSIIWTGVPQGAYTLTAKATDNLNATTTSSPVNVTVGAAAASLYFIHTDHLNTPRVITNQAAQVVWRWDQADPFGGNAPNENPSGLGNFTCNLRLPGQYFDKETNLHYNYFRDYDPSIGRYIQSDPIGFEGGLNLYAYVNNNPLSFTDPLGLMGFGGGGSANQSKGGYSRFDLPPGSPYESYNWCGPGNRAGAPTNCVDRACKKHDECYKRCGVRAATRWFPNTFSGCAAKCDWDLIQDYKACKDDEFCNRPPPPPGPPLPPGA